MDWKIPKLILKGFLKPKWSFCLLFGVTFILLIVGSFVKEFQTKLILSLNLQAVGVILISLWNLWPSSKTKSRTAGQFATTFGGSVGPAFITFTNAIGVGLVLAALFIQISDLINWFLIVAIIFSLVVIILGIINFIRNSL